MARALAKSLDLLAWNEFVRHTTSCSPVDHTTRRRPGAVCSHRYRRALHTFRRRLPKSSASRPACRSRAIRWPGSGVIVVSQPTKRLLLGQRSRRSCRSNRLVLSSQWSRQRRWPRGRFYRRRRTYIRREREARDELFRTGQDIAKQSNLANDPAMHPTLERMRGILDG